MRGCCAIGIIGPVVLGVAALHLLLDLEVRLVPEVRQILRDLRRNEQGRSIAQRLLSVGEMVRHAPGWARRVLTMTSFWKGGTEFGTSPYPNNHV